MQFFERGKEESKKIFLNWTALRLWCITRVAFFYVLFD